MKLIAPDYYNKFSCIADKCTHSCCIGWEIDIDPDTLHKYSQINGAFGKRLRDSISSDETPCFKLLGEEERCPFLNGSGLCDIILNLGEEYLSQICTDHPRFRNYMSDRVEIGLGMCCEAACKIILTHKSKMRLTALKSDNCECGLTDDERALLLLRSRIFRILQDRSFSIEQRLENMLSLCGLNFPQKPIGQWADIFLTLERLDAKWTHLLEYLKASSPAPIIPHEFETCFEQLAVYFIYRHLPDALDDGKYLNRIAFAVLGVHMISALCALKAEISEVLHLDDIVEFCRLYSSEIEYSQDNTQALLDILG